MHVLGNFGHGGAEMGVARLISSATKRSIRHSVCSLGSNISMADSLPAATECFSLGIDGRNLLASWHLYRLMKKKKVSIVHVNNLAPWFDAALAAKIAGIPCIQTFHGIENHLLRRSLVKVFMYKIAHRISYTVTSVSSSAANLLNKISGIGLNSITVIPNGIDLSQFTPAENSAEKRLLRKEFGLPEKAFLFGCVAALRPVKNHKGLFQSFGQICKEYRIEKKESPKLVLIGDGPLMADLKKLAKNINCENSIIFMGQQSETNVKKLLRAFDVFVLNSYTEGLSYALLEALASGLPAIVTSVGSNPDIITDGCEGFLVPPEDLEALATCLGKIIENSTSLPIKAKSARYKSKEYSLNHMISSYSFLYKNAAEKHKKK